MEQFILDLKKLYTVDELEIRWRINGVIEVFRDGYTIRIIDEDKKLNFYPLFEDMKKYVLNYLAKSEAKQNFRKLPSGNISYKEFKYKKSVPEFRNPEDYHWKNNLDKTSERHLYFLVLDNNVKIGMTADATIRMKQLSTGLHGHYIAYIFPNKGFLEHTLHNCFSIHKTKGEWFTFHERIRNFIVNYHDGTNIITDDVKILYKRESTQEQFYLEKETQKAVQLRLKGFKNKEWFPKSCIASDWIRNTDNTYNITVMDFIWSQKEEKLREC